jgi:hypothetical protein
VGRKVALIALALALAGCSFSIQAQGGFHPWGGTPEAVEQEQGTQKSKPYNGPPAKEKTETETTTTTKTKTQEER